MSTEETYEERLTRHVENYLDDMHNAYRLAVKDRNTKAQKEALKWVMYYERCLARYGEE